MNGRRRRRHGPRGPEPPHPRRGGRFRRGPRRLAAPSCGDGRRRLQHGAPDVVGRRARRERPGVAVRRGRRLAPEQRVRRHGPDRGRVRPQLEDAGPRAPADPAGLGRGPGRHRGGRAQVPLIFGDDPPLAEVPRVILNFLDRAELGRGRRGARAAGVRCGPAPRFQDKAVVLCKRAALRFSHGNAVAGVLHAALPLSALVPLAEHRRALAAVAPRAGAGCDAVGQEQREERRAGNLDGHLADRPQRGVLVEAEEGQRGRLGALPPLVEHDRPRRRSGHL